MSTPRVVSLDEPWIRIKHDHKLLICVVSIYGHETRRLVMST
jgi:hypothetical protein